MARSGAMTTGWRILRASDDVVVTPVQRRRRTLAAAGSAALVGTILTATLLVWSWADAPAWLVVLGVLLCAAGGGSLAASWVSAGRLASSPASTPGRPDWRRDERIARQFRADAPALAPRDRDALLDAVERSRGPLVLGVRRTAWLVGGCLGGVLGVAALGAAAWSLTFPTIVLFQALLQSGNVIWGVHRLGAMELAARRAAALPPAPPEPPRTWPKGRGPRGSKTALPGE